MDRGIYDIFTKIPTLYTERLTLRKMSVYDADDMFDYAKRPETSEYLLWSPHESVRFSRGYLRFLQGQYARRNFYDWALVLRRGGKMIGTCGFSHFDAENNAAELGYVINPDFWGMGYAAEAISRVMRFAFENMGLNRVFVRILEGNTQSMRVAEKCHMRKEAVHKNAITVKGKYKTYIEYAILKSEFEVYDLNF
ncbi:MAG: GNAT family N-acetyltransferase [Clostridiales bacterium]|nr:GNAT family N-acetyltransferase [Clostridiales bacterium]